MKNINSYNCLYLINKVYIITQITKALANETGWSKHTVITYLKRLEAKGAVHYEEGMKAKLYFADISRKDAQLQEVDTFLNNMEQLVLLMVHMIKMVFMCLKTREVL